jgi:SAM-dependent methyltransferase
MDKPILLPFDGWEQRFKKAMGRLPYLDRDPETKCVVQKADARDMPLEDDSVDLVFTSPPYLNAIDYLRAHKFSLVWMGHRLKSLRELRGSMVGTERGLYSMDGLPPSLEGRLDRVIEVKKRRAMIRKYLSDMRNVLSEIKRVLRPGCIAFLVVGPTIISSKRTDAVRVMTEIGESIGMETLGSVARRLNPNRRSLPFPTGNKQHPLAHRMRREVIIALRK